jgi:hypothetical protein
MVDNVLYAHSKLLLNEAAKFFWLVRRPFAISIYQSPATLIIAACASVFITLASTSNMDARIYQARC